MLKYLLLAFTIQRSLCKVVKPVKDNSDKNPISMVMKSLYIIFITNIITRARDYFMTTDRLGG